MMSTVFSPICPSIPGQMAGRAATSVAALGGVRPGTRAGRTTSGFRVHRLPEVAGISTGIGGRGIRLDRLEGQDTRYGQDNSAQTGVTAAGP